MYPIIAKALKRKEPSAKWKYVELKDIHYVDRESVWNMWGIATSKEGIRYIVSFYKVNPKALFGLNWPIVKIEEEKRRRR